MHTGLFHTVDSQKKSLRKFSLFSLCENGFMNDVWRSLFYAKLIICKSNLSYCNIHLIGQFMQEQIYEWCKSLVS